MASEQWGIMKKRRDIQAFTASLSRLSQLKHIRLSFTGAQEDTMLWFSSRLFIEYEHTLTMHLEAVFQGLAAAQKNGILVESVELEGVHSEFLNGMANIIRIAQQALLFVKFLKLNNSAGMFDMISGISLPYMQKIEVNDCWLVGSQLMRFLELHRAVVQHVEFRRTCLLYEKYNSTHSSSNSVSLFWETILETGSTGKIEILVITQPNWIQLYFGFPALEFHHIASRLVLITLLVSLAAKGALTWETLWK